jgi:hypothetical protein
MDNKYENDTKGSDAFIEDARAVDSSKANTVDEREDGYRDIDYGFDPAEVKRTLRKVDLRLIPILCAMYFVSQCDRTNLGQARAANNKAMEVDLDLKRGNNRFGLITLMFFIPYILLEIPCE